MEALVPAAIARQAFEPRDHLVELRKLVLPLCTVRRDRHHRRHDIASFAHFAQGLRYVAQLFVDRAEFAVAYREVALQSRIAAIEGGEALRDRESVAVELEPLLEIALRHQHIAD